MRADCLLYANGRTGNTDKLHLDKVGLKPDSRGQLKVNQNYCTDVEHIYAVGDVIGYLALPVRLMTKAVLWPRLLPTAQPKASLSTISHRDLYHS